MAQNNQQLSRTDLIGNELKARDNQINALLGDKEKAKHFLAAAYSVCNDKSLADCSVDSVINAAIGAAMLNLSIDKNIGHCYLVNYRGIAQLQIGYRGYTQLLFRAGWVIKAFPVYVCDFFELTNDGWENKISFTPDIDSQDEGDRDWVYQNLRGVYVVAKHAITGDTFSRFASKKLIEKIRLSSPGQKLGKFTSQRDKDRLKAGLPIGTYEDWYVDMAMAKAIKKLSKILPIGDARAEMAIAISDYEEKGSIIDYKRTVEKGTIIEEGEEITDGDMATEDDLDVDSILEEIKSCKTLDELDALLPEIQKFQKPELYKIRKVFTQTQRIIADTPTTDTPATGSDDWSTADWDAEIENASSTQDLEIIFDRMSDDDKAKYQGKIIERNELIQGDNQ